MPLSFADLLSVKSTDPGFKAVQKFGTGKLNIPSSLKAEILAASKSGKVRGSQTPSTKKAILALAALRSNRSGSFVGPLNRIRTIYGLPENGGYEEVW